METIWDENTGGEDLVDIVYSDTEELILNRKKNLSQGTSGKIEKFNLNNSTMTELLSVQETVHKLGINKMDNKLYWTNNSDVFDRMNLDGSDKETAIDSYDYGLYDYVGSLDGFAFYEILSSTKDPQPPLAVTVSPNPSNGTININVNESGQSNLKIFNLQGTLLYNFPTLQGQFELSLDFNPGMYIMKFENPSTGKTAVQKLILNQ